MDPLAAARAWITRDPDPETRAEAEALVASGDLAAIGARFGGRLSFGTAGLRAEMGAGPTRMNRLVVRESAAGIARHLLASDPDAGTRGVVVAFDARHRSRAFAADCADVITAHGIPVHLGGEPTPTPVGVFAIRLLGAAAGIVITASHNPPADNGLKLYLADAAQIVPPVDGQVAEAIEAVAADGIVTPDGPRAQVTPLGEAAVDAYRRATLARVPAPATRIRIATSAMHGVGGALLARLLADAGHADVHPVREQERPDADFPTVAFPNPEEPGATDLLARRMRDTDAVLGLAVDPDADRVAVLVRERGGAVRQLTGDEVGALLGEWLLAEVTAGPDRLTASSVVSSSLLGKVAAAHGAHHEETLTGFKWLCRPALAHPEWTQVLAYEEAIGYAIGADVRDKDGLSAAVAVASMASSLIARGRDLLDLLDELHAHHGAHVNDNFSLRYSGDGWQGRRAEALAALTGAPPSRLGALGVDEVRLLAPDVIRLDLPGLRIVVRPSGTEPKLKCYCEAVEPATGGDLPSARARATKRLAGARPPLAALLGAT